MEFACLADVCKVLIRWLTIVSFLGCFMSFHCVCFRQTELQMPNLMRDRAAALKIITSLD